MSSHIPDLGSLQDLFRCALGVNYTPPVHQRVNLITKAYRAKLKSYARAVSGKQKRLMRGREYLMLRSSAAKLVGIAAAHKGAMLTFPELEAKAFQLRPRAACVEPIRATRQDKPEGGFRITCSAPKTRRAAERLAKDLILAGVGYSPYEYVRKGRGRDAAAAAGLHQMNHHGVRWLSLCDVKSFFPSCTRKMASEAIPLSRALLNNAVFVSPDTPIAFTNTTHDTILEQAVRHGLIEGSQTSGIVAQKIMESRLDAISAPLKVCHGDNIMIGTRTEAECSATTSAFASQLEKHPDGPLQLKEADIFKVGDTHMDFCGYRLRPPHSLAPKRTARATPSRKAFTRFERRALVRLVLAFGQGEDELIASYSRLWSASFGLWLGGQANPGLTEIGILSDIAPLAPKLRSRVKAKSFADLPSEVRRHAALLIPESLTYAGGGWSALKHAPGHGDH